MKVKIIPSGIWIDANTSTKQASFSALLQFVPKKLGPPFVMGRLLLLLTSLCELHQTGGKKKRGQRCDNNILVTTLRSGHLRSLRGENISFGKKKTSGTLKQFGSSVLCAQEPIKTLVQTVAERTHVDTSEQQQQRGLPGLHTDQWVIHKLHDVTYCK